MTTNKVKAEELVKLLEEKKLTGMTMDMMVIQLLLKITEEIDDKKLQIKMQEFYQDMIKEYGERDLEEEAKTEFYCSSCGKFLPLDKKIESEDICINCNTEEDDAGYDEY